MLVSLLDTLPCAAAVYNDPKAAAVWTNQAARDSGVPESLAAAEDRWRRVALPDDHTALIWTTSQGAAESAHQQSEMQQFAHVVSHDLQAHARTVAAYLELLVEEHGDTLAGEAREFVDFAVTSAKHMQALLAGILAWSLVESQAREPADVSSNDALEMALFDLRGVVESTGALVQHGDLPPVCADRAQLLDLLTRLLDNALKFHGASPPNIQVDGRREGDLCAFTVRDGGIGIESRYLERVLGVFQRLHTTSEYPGVGIGLAICERIVGRHGGSLLLESEPGAGLTVRFTLPAAADDFQER